jgi:hypothetical protein
VPLNSGATAECCLLDLSVTSDLASWFFFTCQLWCVGVSTQKRKQASKWEDKLVLALGSTRIPQVVTPLTLRSPTINYYTGEGGKVLYFNWASRHEGVLGEWRYSFTHSLTSALGGSEWSASRPGSFTPRETPSSTHWIRGWVGTRAGLDAVVKEKNSYPCWDSNPQSTTP